MKTITPLLSSLLLVLACGVTAAERFASTLGTVEKEISADRVTLRLQVTAIGKTPEDAAASLEKLLAGLSAEAARLKYPASAFTTITRATEKEWDYENQKKKFMGFAASATLSVKLVNLTNYNQFLTFLGVNDGYEIVWVSLASSAEGGARQQAIAEALQIARAKAELLAAEGRANLGKLFEVTEEEVETREYYATRQTRNSRDPNEGKGVFPIGIFVRVRAKFELLDK